MSTGSGTPSLYRFAEFEFHASTGELHGRGRCLQLPDQVCRVLLALLGSEGEVVAREELCRALWPDRTYGDFEAGLNTAVFKLRQALEDDGAEPRLVGTLPRRGYRMLVPVERGPACPKAEEGLPDSDTGAETAPPQAAEAGSPAPEPASSRARRIRLAGGILLLSAGVLLLLAAAGSGLDGSTGRLARGLIRPIQVLRGRAFQNTLGMEFVYIPPGSFVMGNDSWEREMRPAHEVTLTRPFMLQATEVTVGQFRRFIEATGYHTDAESGDGMMTFKGPHAALVGLASWERKSGTGWRNPGFPQGEDSPVVGVSWDDAQAFIAWLNETEPGRSYRLPTEAEWEYASRAGVRVAWLGDPDSQAWHAGNSGWRTHPAGGRSPNAFGLYDTLGNVWEWCQDWYAGPFEGSAPWVDPTGPRTGETKVIKGASWNTPRASSQWSNRGGRLCWDSYDDLGFRLAAEFRGS